MLWVVQDLRYRWVLSHNYFVADEYRNGRALGAHHGARSIRQLAVGAGENLQNQEVNNNNNNNFFFNLGPTGVCLSRLPDAFDIAGLQNSILQHRLEVRCVERSGVETIHRFKHIVCATKGKAQFKQVGFEVQTGRASNGASFKLTPNSQRFMLNPKNQSPAGSYLQILKQKAFGQ